MMNMKLPQNRALILSGALFLAACSGHSDNPSDKVAAAGVPGAPPTAAADIAAKNAVASDVKESNDLLEFAYSYPADAARIAKLAEWLDTDRATRREALATAAQRDKGLAEKQGYPYRAHSHLQSWKRVANTPRFLSLSSEIWTYTGGAHGMTAFETLLWDRNRAARLKPLDLFSSAEAFDAAIRDDFCAGIARAKAAKGVEPTADNDNVFAKCPPASAQTVWLGSSDGRYLDRLTIAIAPYEVGPYVEGSYMINLPMTAALARALKPEYARDFLPLS